MNETCKHHASNKERKIFELSSISGLKRKNIHIGVGMCRWSLLPILHCCKECHTEEVNVFAENLCTSAEKYAIHFSERMDQGDKTYINQTDVNDPMVVFPFVAAVAGHQDQLDASRCQLASSSRMRRCVFGIILMKAEQLFMFQRLPLIGICSADGLSHLVIWTGACSCLVWTVFTHGEMCLRPVWRNLKERKSKPEQTGLLTFDVWCEKNCE